MRNPTKTQSKSPLPLFGEKTKFKILPIMLLLLTLQNVQGEVKSSENKEKNFSHTTGNAKFENYTKSLLRKFLEQIKSGNSQNVSNSSGWQYAGSAGDFALLIKTKNVTVVNNNNVNTKNADVDIVNKKDSEKIRTKSPTTEFYENSSDLKAKDKNCPKNPSLSNVPEANKKLILSNDLNQSSFIYNVSEYKKISSYDEREKEKSNDLNLDVDFNNDEEVIAREQKILLNQVSDFGLQQMKELFDKKERKIYEAGIFLPKGSPGSYLAAFNQQSEELKFLSKYGYAALKASVKLKEELANSKLRQEILNVTEDSTKNFPEISLLDTSLHDHCPLKTNPRCPTWKHLFRTPDGTCNNLKNPWWGAIFQPLKRFLSPHYNDGLEEVRESVRGGPLPSPRLISTAVLWDRDVSSRSVTHMFTQWGQFIDHDMTSSSQSRGFNGSVPRCCDTPPDLLHPDCLPIGVPSTDPFFSKFGIRCLEFLRSAPSSRVGCRLGPREQINQVTSYIDGSMIYGNTEREASSLRLFRNGMLKYTRMPQRLPLLPSDVNRGEFCRRSNTDFFCFHSGDNRMNEQPGLMALHVVFLRLHNRLTRQLAHINPLWPDERLYQETRKIVGAILQHITYREYLPIVLGQDVMNIFEIQTLKEGYYENYDERVSATAANAFAAAAFRFGHSMVQGKYLKWDDIRKEPVNNVSLHEELLDPGLFHKFGAVDNYILGMCIQESQKRDEHFSVELTNHLFQTPNFPAGLDLAAINIQRGRDHGIPSYNSWRNPCGLRKLRTWDDLLHVMPEETRDNLRKIYRDVDDIDLYVGGLSEFSVRGGIVGSTFSCIIAQHFKNIRKGDRFWYENGGFDNSFTKSQLKAIRKITLARILCDNLDLIETIQPFAFLTVDNLRNPKIPCRSTEIPLIDLSPWEETPKGKWIHSSKQPEKEIPLEMPELKSDTLSNETPSPMEVENEI